MKRRARSIKTGKVSILAPLISIRQPLSQIRVAPNQRTRPAIRTPVPNPVMPLSPLRPTTNPSQKKCYWSAPAGLIATLFFETHKLIDSEDLVNDEKYVQEIEKFTQAVAPYVQNEDLSTIIVPIFKGARRTAHETLEDFNPLRDLLLRSMALPPSFLDSSQFPNQPSGNMKGATLR